MSGTNMVHKYIHVLKFARLEYWVLTLKVPVSWFASVIGGGGGGGNPLYFVWYRRAAGIAPIFQVIYT